MMSDDDLIERLEAVQQSVDNLREDYKLEAKKRDRRIRLTQAAIVVALLVAFLTLWHARTTSQHLDAANRDRAQRTIVACQQYNEQQSLQITTEIKQSHDL